jgi:pilus assembly protein Flp/PilA
MSKLIAAAKKFVKAEEGATLVEYGLLVGLIAVVAVGAIVILGTTIAGYFTNINAAL